MIPSSRRKFAMELACGEAGWGYQVLAEPDRQLLTNVRWLAGFREPPADPDGECARMLLALAAGPCTIQSFSQMRSSRWLRDRC